MDLFAAAEGISSGEVPREVWPGIIWDEAAEDMFDKIYRDWADHFPAIALEERARAQALQTSCWHVELHLLRSTIAREAAAALELFDAAEKRRMHTEWLLTYGAKLTDAIVRACKDPQLRSPDLGRRL
ncbi:MAG: hypothetical protein ACJ75S_07255 [Solirubrobacterales bacterium]|jgi:hypothetical protein